ncbi:c-type cytochrome [Granulicella arctica]|uniref:c-type cytochrome n=1 Tax=Granulicella arctica TaxID=940613 RepID=UPI0021DF9147|nr:c-type cytochrome [Granulicella arctica]
MKRLRIAVFVAAAFGMATYSSKLTPIYAASNGEQAGATQAAAVEGANSVGAKAYASHCSMCHGQQREGMAPIFPSLVGVGRRLTDEQILGIVHNGRGKMPAQPALEAEEVNAIIRFLKTDDLSGAKAATSSASDLKAVHTAALTGPGNSIFQQNCAFCHGRDAGGGEAGPDLTRSKLVASDVNGDKISDVVRNGRIEKKMPAFKFSNDELASVVEYIHAQADKAKSQKPGSRKGVDVSDLQTGNAEAGKKYFTSAGCVKCHSETGDMAGVATRFQGLQLEERMLYPRDAKSTVAVTLPSGEKVSGTLAYQDEFTVGLKGSDGVYHSWNVNNVKFTVDSPVDAHVEQFPKYTDGDIHNLMAYLQTLK